jgi:hypothetical protein
MSDDPKIRSRRWGWIGWVLLAAIILYPLSIGPAVVVLVRYHNPSVARACNFIYGPLLFAAKSNRTVGLWLGRYKRWWAERFLR